MLEDQGILRRHRDYSLNTDFLPQLFGQVQFNLANTRENAENIDSILNFTMRGQAKTHKEAMVKEYKKREEKKKEELRQQKEREEQKRKRKEERAAARERHRIHQVQERIFAQVIGS